jgi:hypothetical protein
MSMSRPNHVAQRGEINLLVIPMFFLVVLFISAAGFGYWAWTGRQDYKNNVDQKVTVAVSQAVNENSIKKDKEFAEREKNPLEIFEGPEAYGSIKIAHPKTWSIYVASPVTNPQPLDAYFSPRAVPSINDNASVFTLRVKVIPNSYAAVIKALDNNIKAGKIKATPFALEKVPEVVGIRADGEVIQNRKLNGAMIVLPMRDKTLQVWTEDAQSLNDFNNIIVKNMSFSP